MFGLRRFYNQNRGTIWIVITVLMGIILILQVLNNLAKNKKENNSSGNSITTTVSNNYSVITGQKIDEEEAIEVNNVIDNFFTYCNERNFEKAYMLLSNDCKREMFPTYDTFINNYASSIFNVFKLYEAQAWIKSNVYTYKVTITEDSLASGKVSSNLVEDYFTIVEENGEYKLNINNYIGKKDINKTIENGNIKITVINKQIYMDYEIYTIKVENNTNDIILLDGFRNNKSIYLTDTNGTKRISILNENIESEFIVQRNLSITKEIKFNKQYSTDVGITSMSFDDIILHYNNYKNFEDKNLYEDILKLNISL